MLFRVLTFLRTTERPVHGPRYGPKPGDHPTVGDHCPLCSLRFQAGDYTTLVVLGPGNDLEERENAAAGAAYNAYALEIHWTCATGEEMRT